MEGTKSEILKLKYKGQKIIIVIHILCSGYSLILLSQYIGRRILSLQVERWLTVRGVLIDTMLNYNTWNSNKKARRKQKMNEFNMDLKADIAVIVFRLLEREGVMVPILSK